MDQIIPGLWIGDLACALATDYLAVAGVTHIVTALKQRLPSPITLPDGREIDEEHMYHINLDDVENAPILVHFPDTVEFIDQALKQEWLEDGVVEENDEEEKKDLQQKQEQEKQESNQSSSNEIKKAQEATVVRDKPPAGRKPGQWATMGEGTVFVHCHAGISRSVALVTAYLMHVRRMSRDEALALIRSRRPQADPNSGFMHQLELYESADYSVDVRNQRIRRFLMSQSSILRGDPIDDVMLSYYPSPFHSPAGSVSGGSGSMGPFGGGLQFSTLDGGESASTSPTVRQTWSRRGSATSIGGSASPVSSLAMSRQNSRKAVSTAAARGANERHQRTRSRSEGMMTCVAGRTFMSSSSRIRTDGDQTLLDLSKSPPMPERSFELFDADDDSMSSVHRDDKVQALIRQSFTSVRDPHEVMITVSSGNLPGGVTKVRGNQTTTASKKITNGVVGKGATPGTASDALPAAALGNSTSNSSAQQQKLPKPHFAGTKLRCRMCRRELAAQDHVVEHEPGKGKDAFDVRKREKDVEQKSRDGRVSMTHTARHMSTEERFGAHRRPAAPHSSDQNEGGQIGQQDGADDAGETSLQSGQDVQAPLPSQANATPASAYKSAASLSAQLPPHLAALRLGRNSGQGPAAEAQRSQSSPAQAKISSDAFARTQRFTGGSGGVGVGTTGDLRKLLHSPACSSYFVEPLAWMSSLRLGEIAGRLECPNQRCSAKLGSWDWAGMQCACGAWVTPAFALHRSKVDEV